MGGERVEACVSGSSAGREPGENALLSLAGRRGGGEGPDVTRLTLFFRLMVDLSGLERATRLEWPGHGEGVLFVWVAGRRWMPVLCLADTRGRWSYLWDEGRTARADGSLTAAREIAEARR